VQVDIGGSSHAARVEWEGEGAGVETARKPRRSCGIPASSATSCAVSSASGAVARSHRRRATPATEA